MARQRGGLPAAPFKKWLEKRMSETKEAPDALARRLSINGRTVRGVLEMEIEEVTLDLVDRAFTEDGTVFLWEYYPKLYEFDEVPG